jgi:sRNA-binding carbon storage regulator CsrA
MLIITRRVGEKLNFYLDGLKIGSLLVSRVNRHQVKIGLSFDDNVRVMRDELCESQKDDEPKPEPI